MSAPLPFVKHLSLGNKGDPLRYHHFICDVLSTGAHKISALFELFNEYREGFSQVVRPHCAVRIILEVDLIDRSIGPEKIIHNLQVRDLAKTCQLILDQGK